LKKFILKNSKLNDKEIKLNNYSLADSDDIKQYLSENTIEPNYFEFTHLGEIRKIKINNTFFNVPNKYNETVNLKIESYYLYTKKGN
jgi:phosphorylcholine metabolism protein LicD